MKPDPARFDRMTYPYCGTSGLQPSRLALGMWNNFGANDDYTQARAVFRTAIEYGITHIDLAAGYGPPARYAEETFGRLMRDDWPTLRNDLVITSKAGHRSGPGPYYTGGSRKYLLQSCEISLTKMNLDYLDIFYHHAPDPATPMIETARALAHLVKTGKALYVGVSNYKPDQVREMAALLDNEGVPLTIHQPCYNAINREAERELLPTLSELGIGCAVYSPLAQGRLTDRYVDGIPADSRAGREGTTLKADQITDDVIAKVRRLRDEIAKPRGWTVAQLALAWVLRRSEITSAIIGASRPEQIKELGKIPREAPLTTEEQALFKEIMA